MWLILMFDLPVLTKTDRRHATRFRTWLLDQGWEMSQFSVYLRFCVGKEQVDTRIREVSRVTPPRGKIHIVSITDRQFERMTVFHTGTRARGKRSPQQFEMF